MAHVGDILNRAIPNPLSTRTYLLVRNILQVLAELLENIEISRFFPPNIAAKLRTQIVHIDQCMQQNSEQDSQSRRFSAGQNLSINSPPNMNGTGYLNHSKATGAMNAVQESNFPGTTDIAQRSVIPNSGSEFVFPPVLRTSHTAELFEDWPILSGQTDSLDPVGAFLSLGNGITSTD